MQSIDTASRLTPLTGPPPSVYPGLGPFGDNQWHQQLFAGRKEEAEALVRMILASPITLLFGRSGVGKTSLINAGLLPILRDRGMIPVVVRPSRDPLRGPAAAIMARVVEACAACQLTIPLQADEGLWEFFYRISQPLARSKRMITLVLDPFEEVFTTIRAQPGWGPGWERVLMEDLADIVRSRVPERVRERARLVLEDESRDEDEASSQAQALLYSPVRLEVKVVLSLAEDFLPELHGFRLSLPTVFDNALRLQALTPAEAKEAIVVPGQRAAVIGQEPFTVDDAVVDQMIRFLTARKPEESLDEAHVEPAQLQMLCYAVDKRRRARGGREITKEDLGGLAGMQRLTDRYYRRVLLNVPLVRAGWNARRWRLSRENWLLVNRPRAAARRLCEGGLVLAWGQRNSLAEPAIRRTYGVPVGDLTTLVERRLLRVETRLGTMFYELSVDSLANTVRRAGVRRRLQHAGVAGLMLVAAALGFVMQTRKQERSIANQLSDISRSLAPQDPQEALRVATVAVEHTNTRESEEALRNALAGPYAIASRKLPSKAKQVVVTARGAGLVVGEDERLYLVDVGGLGLPAKPIQDSVYAVALSPDRRRVAVGTTSGMVLLLETSDLSRPAAATRTGDTVVSALGFSRDGGWVVAASARPIAAGSDSLAVHVTTWNPARSQRAVFTPLLGAREGVRANAVAVSPDAKQVVTVHHDSLARVWNSRTGMVEHELRHGGYVYTATFSPDGRWLLTAGQDKTISIWSTDRWALAARIQPGADNVNDVQFSPDSSRLLCATRDRQLLLWQWNGDAPGRPARPTWTMLYRWTAHDASVRSAAFSPDGRWIVSVSDDATLKVWNAGRNPCENCRPDSLLAIARERLRQPSK